MNIVESIVGYFRSSAAELEKVSWPSRRDTLRYGGLVVAASVILAIFFATLDFGLQKTVENVLTRKTPTETNGTQTSSTNPGTTPDFVPGSIQGTTSDGKVESIQVVPIVEPTP